MLGYTTYFILKLLFGSRRAADYRLRARHARKTRITRGLVGWSLMAGIVLPIMGDAFFNTASVHVVEVAQASIPESVAETVLLNVVIDWTRERVIQEVKTAATKYGVSYEKMYKTVECESNFNPKIQSGHTLSYGREESWGVSQFHIPSRNLTSDGTVITKEMALDPAIALDAMAYHFSVGNARAWTCYRLIYGVK